MLCSGANEGGVAVKRVKLFGASDEVRQRELFFRVFSFVAAVDERPTSFFLEAKFVCGAVGNSTFEVMSA